MSEVSSKPALTVQETANFFQSLYQGRESSPDTPVKRADFHKAAARLVASSKSITTVGQTALQTLIVNYFGSGKDCEKDADFFAAIAVISRAGVAELVRKNPNITLQELMKLAEENGFDVEIAK